MIPPQDAPFDTDIGPDGATTFDAVNMGAGTDQNYSTTNQTEETESDTANGPSIDFANPKTAAAAAAMAGVAFYLGRDS